MTVPSVSTSVTIDLQNQGVNAGAAAGDRFYEVENIIGTSRSDTILGDNLATIFAAATGPTASWAVAAPTR
jgi:hypothetical protein